MEFLNKILRKRIVILATVIYSINFLIAGIPKLVKLDEQIIDESIHIISSLGIPAEGTIIVGTIEVTAAFCIWFRNKNILGPLSCIGTLIITSIAIPLQLHLGFTIGDSLIAIIGFGLSIFLLINYRNKKIITHRL